MQLLKQAVTLTFLIFLVGEPNPSQTLNGLEQRYERLDSRHFRVRPGMFATVTVTRTGQVHRVVISQQPVEQDVPKLMSQEVVTEVINEIAPASRRGKALSEITFTAGAASVDVAQYEHATIRRITIRTLEGVGEKSAEITWRI